LKKYEETKDFGTSEFIKEVKGVLRRIEGKEKETW